MACPCALGCDGEAEGSGLTGGTCCRRRLGGKPSIQAPGTPGTSGLRLQGQPGAAPSRRYRNFRTFTSPRPTQFSCVAVDSSGEIVAAGAQDSFEVFIWSMQTGRLLEVIGPRPSSRARRAGRGGGTWHTPQAVRALPPELRGSMTTGAVDLHFLV